MVLPPDADADASMNLPVEAPQSVLVLERLGSF